jgi:hypothetical protein
MWCGVPALIGGTRQRQYYSTNKLPQRLFEQEEGDLVPSHHPLLFCCQTTTIETDAQRSVWAGGGFKKSKSWQRHTHTPTHTCHVSCVGCCWGGCCLGTVARERSSDTSRLAPISRSQHHHRPLATTKPYCSELLWFILINK